ncbi:MAG: SdiA-regulated domain-containing protein [Gammaproteobacteria bacterium]|nr:SdiA-regulated domain-containing protein [Gammaproteobacteria bacterium]
MSLFPYSVKLILTLFLLFHSNPNQASDQLINPPLKLSQALTLDYSEPLQPSGLTMCGDRLLMIADDQDDFIFELKLKQGSAQVSVLHNLKLTEKPPFSFTLWQKVSTLLQSLISRKIYDWEGISCDNENNIYLLSERFLAIAKVNTRGEATWLGLELYKQGFKKGLFQIMNAYTEGIAWYAPDNFIIAAERNPRGILKASLIDGHWSLNKVETLPASPISIANSRSEDFSGLWIENDSLFTLERNYFSICRRDIQTLKTKACWSYQNTEHHPAYRFADTHFGTAEGLAKKDQQLYVVLDNNLKANLHNNDSRPLLLVFELPENWSPNHSKFQAGGKHCNHSTNCRISDSTDASSRVNRAAAAPSITR